jgi:hypothetical protein
MPFPLRLLPLIAAAALLVDAPVEAQSPTLLRLSNPASAERLVVDSAGGLVVSGTVNEGTIPASGAGVRLMWYPRKGALRAGGAGWTEWDDVNIGYFSTATGGASTASGDYSIAMGYNTTASGEGAIAMGYNTTASGYYATALGRGTSAAWYATALGYQTVSGVGSTAMGWNTSADGTYATATGAHTVASGTRSTALGSSTTASGTFSLATGSQTRASGSGSTAMGTSTTASGTNSTAMGSHASTDWYEGSFVYGDNSTTTVMNANYGNQFSVRAAGGYRFFSNSALSSGVTLTAGASSWTTVSDRNRKELFLALDGEDILQRLRVVPVTSWRYIAEEDRNVRHIGPMAQDWNAAFPELGGDGLTINTGDFDGVNLAAAQALERRTAEQAARLRVLEAENAALRARLDGVEQMEMRLRRLEELAGTAVEPGAP